MNKYHIEVQFGSEEISKLYITSFVLTYLDNNKIVEHIQHWLYDNDVKKDLAEICAKDLIKCITNKEETYKAGNYRFKLEYITADCIIIINKITIVDDKLVKFE